MLCSLLQSAEWLVTEKLEKAEGAAKASWVRHASSLMDQTKATDWSLADGSAELPVELPLPNAEGVLDGVMQEGGSRL